MSWESLDAGIADTRQYLAGDHTAGRPGVVLLHAWWGLDDDVTAFADRLAGAGFAVAAPDLVAGRIAATAEEAEALAQGADEDHADAVVLASIDTLAGRLGTGTHVATVGFSFGAAWSVWAAAERDCVAATVVYYGAVLGPSIERSATPVLGHFAEHDEFEPEENVTAFEGALLAARRSATIHRYPGTGHWFAEPSRDAFRQDAADLAFTRTVDFLHEHLAS